MNICIEIKKRQDTKSFWYMKYEFFILSLSSASFTIVCHPFCQLTLLFMPSASFSLYLVVSWYVFVAQVPPLVFTATEGKHHNRKKEDKLPSFIPSFCSSHGREDKPCPESHGSLHPPPPPSPHSPCRWHRRSVSMTTGELRAKGAPSQNDTSDFRASEKINHPQ